MQNLKNYGIHGKSTLPFQDLAYLIAIVYNKVNRKLDLLLRKHKLSVPKFNILMVVRFQGLETGLSQKAISERLIVSDGNITGILDRMEKAKLLMRTPHPSDRRVNLVKITPKGDQLLQTLMPHYEALLKENVDLFPQKEQTLLLSIFEKWATKLV